MKSVNSYDPVHIQLFIYTCCDMVKGQILRYDVPFSSRSCAMSISSAVHFRTLTNGIARTSGLSAFRHSTGGASGAVLDRYRFIRTFFRQQHTALQVVRPKVLTQTLRPRLGVHSTFLRLDTLVSYRKTGSHPRQHFHSTGSVKSPGSIPEKPAHRDDSLKSQAEKSSIPQDDIKPAIPLPPPRNLDDYSHFFRRLAVSLPHLHRPTRDDFLNVANGFWQRTRIHFKWFTIKSFRKFNADDISAFVTWFLMSQTLWILVGT